MKPHTAYIITTNRCNMRCVYCYEHEFFKNNFKNMSLDTMNKTSDFLIKNAEKNNLVDGKNHVGMFYFGGEPTLAWDTIKENIMYNQHLEQATGYKIGLYFLTNGYVLPANKEEFFKMIRDKHIKVQVSLDGCKKAHDTTRGHFDDIVKNIKEFQSTQCSPITVRMTVTTENIHHAYESFVAMGDLSCEIALTLELECDWKEEHIQITKEQFSKIMNYYKKINSKKPFKFNISHKICKGGFSSCHLSGNMVGVDVDGNIYPCHRFIFHDDAVSNWKMGDVFNGITRTFDFSNYFNECKHCECMICHPCPSAYIIHKNQLHDTYCKLYKSIQNTCEPISKEVHAYNVEQVLISFMKMILEKTNEKQNTCSKSA